MSGEERGPFTIAPEELRDLLGSPDLRPVDASWYLPAQNRDAKAEFAAARIPGAVYFDIDAISDRDSDLPHMMPTAAEFGEAVGKLGISNEDDIVVYDGPGVFSAPRVWWMLRVMGAARVRLLDGGFDGWRQAGLPVETGAPADPAPAQFDAVLAPGVVTDKEEILSGLKSGHAQILDARAFERFAGRAPEPRPGLRPGHIPGSRSLPFDQLQTDGKLKNISELKEIFQPFSLKGRPAITTCGSGVTAAVISLALATVGHEDHSLYDGSWAEWGQPGETPVARWEE